MLRNARLNLLHLEDRTVPASLHDWQSLLGVPVTELAVTGNNRVLNLSFDTPVGVSVEGRNNFVRLSLGHPGDSPIAGVGIEVAGSGNTVFVEIPGSVDRMYYFGSGNHNVFRVSVDSFSEVNESHIDLTGNRNVAVVTVAEDGVFRLTSVNLSGNQPYFSLTGPGSFYFDPANLHLSGHDPIFVMYH